MCNEEQPHLLNKSEIINDPTLYLELEIVDHPALHLEPVTVNKLFNVIF